MGRVDPSLIAAAKSYDSLFVPALFGQWSSTISDVLGVSEGNTVLDIACGTGALASEMAKRVGLDGSVFAVDANLGMLEVAHSRFPEIVWKEADASDLPFTDDHFDFVACQFGLMFFPDPAKAVSEMLRVLKPGGAMLVAVWDQIENIPGYFTEMKLIEEMAGKNAGNAVRVPFQLGDKSKLKGIFESVGASNVDINTMPGKARFPSIRVMVEAELRGWLPIMDVHLSDEKIESILSEAQTVMNDFSDESGAVEFDVASHFVTYQL